MNFSILSFLTLIALNCYLLQNVLLIGEGAGVSLNLLGLVIASLTTITLVRVALHRSLCFHKSAGFMALFYWYFIFRINVDIGEVERLKTLTIGTTGGTLLFYLLGLLLSLADEKNFKLALSSKRNFYTNAIMTTFFLFVSSFFVFNIFLSFATKLELNRLLIANLDGLYQRPGNFLIISSLIVSVAFFNMELSCHDCKALVEKVLKFFNRILYFLYSATAIVTSQLFGSNNALVTVSAITGITIGMCLILRFPSFLSSLRLKKLSFRQLFMGKTGVAIVIVSMSGLLIFLAVSLATVSFLDIDVGQMRIMNFGKGGLPTSVTSRFAILEKDFFPQFAYSPILGTMNVYLILQRSRMHSFSAGVLTKMGILGFCLFLFFILFAGIVFFKTKFVPVQKAHLFEVNVKKLHILLLFCAIFFIGNLAEVIGWIPLWFSMGFFLPTVSVKGKNFETKCLQSIPNLIDMKGT